MARAARRRSRCSCCPPPLPAQSRRRPHPRPARGAGAHPPRARRRWSERMANLQGNVHDLARGGGEPRPPAHGDGARAGDARPAARSRSMASCRSPTDRMATRGGRADRSGAGRSSAGWWTSTSAVRCTRPRRMLSARSFGELVARYKYLHEIAVHDRSLVKRVETLRDDIAPAAERAGEAPRRRGARTASDKLREEERLREPQAAARQRASCRHSAAPGRSSSGSPRSGSRRRGSATCWRPSRLSGVRTAAARPNAPRVISTLKSADARPARLAGGRAPCSTASAA